MLKRILLWGPVAVVVAGVVALAIFLRPPQVEPFEPTAEEAEQLALYQRPESWFLEHLQQPQVEVEGQLLDPKFQYMFRQGGGDAPPPLVRKLLFGTSAGREFVRANLDRHWTLFSKVTAPMRKVENRHIDGRGGAIPVRIYWPEVESSEPLPMLVYAHGGGYIFASVASHDRAVRLMANEAKVIAISIDYRRAPEHPYPAAGDDFEDAFLWALENAAALGGDPQRVGVGGDSAGGHAAINVAQRQLMKGGAAPAMLLLYYPSVGLPHADRSFELFGKGYDLDASFFDLVLPMVFPGKQIGVDAVDDFMAPLQAKSIAGLPPTLLVTPGFDVLRDSGRAFAERLRTEGVPVAFCFYPSLTHSFLQFSGVIEDADRAASQTAQLFGEGIRNSLRTDCDMAPLPAQTSQEGIVGAKGFLQRPPDAVPVMARGGER